MKQALRGFKVSAVCAAVLAGGCASLPHDVALGVMNSWEPPSATVGRELLDEYGLPDDVTPSRLTWNRHGFWKRTVVWNQRPVYRTSADLAVMRQTIDYPLNLKQTEELLGFSDRLEIDLARGELSSRAREEKINFLTLNLADEIARGMKTVPEARETYARIVALSAAGKSSPYTDGLLFAVGG